jgi:hypothetical protein
MAPTLLGSSPWLRHVHRSKLLEDTEVVPARSYDPRDLASREAKGGGRCPTHLAARRCDAARRALPFSLVGSAPSPDSRHLVLLGELPFYGDAVVGKGGKQRVGGSPSRL